LLCFVMYPGEVLGSLPLIDKMSELATRRSVSR